MLNKLTCHIPKESFSTSLVDQCRGRAENLFVGTAAKRNLTTKMTIFKISNVWKIVLLLIQFCTLGTITFTLPVTAAPKGPGKGPPGPDCYINTVLEAATQGVWDEAYKICPRPKVQYPEITAAVKDFNVDDKCYNKCLYSELGVISDDGKLKRDVVKVIFKGNMTEEMMSKTNKVWNICVDESEKATEAKADKPCLIFPMHMFCFQKKSLEEKIYQKC